MQTFYLTGVSKLRGRNIRSHMNATIEAKSIMLEADNNGNVHVWLEQPNQQPDIEAVADNVATGDEPPCWF
jgi:hypothetical protein